MRVRRFVLLIVFALAAAGGQTFAQSPPAQESIAEELMGASVFAADGTEVGEVSAVLLGAAGDISEIRIVTPSPLGIGERTVILPRGSYMVLRGAVVVDLSAAEVDALPSAGDSSSPRLRAPA
jgi:hypothetical protein